MFVNFFHEPTALFFELLTIRLTQQRARAAFNSVWAIDGVGCGCHGRRPAYRSSRGLFAKPSESIGITQVESDEIFSPLFAKDSDGGLAGAM